ncbi:2-iminoacetate synthase [Sedimentisphaera cyanobacteriorum]|uniref:2-iminoacetate synthase n=1 Tax=Sedimentisphaera cyanobacteriorum TaxID=1940790 RepID=A0A1Q2HQ10_9BACT|nr:2-iminoacetate synthase ThiH [Sedimentisphaera cyanobacteriorum]AQQ09323.1 2-iminoacetate synthase [Sedimentisphaera cyanobacteriorum]
MQNKQFSVPEEIFDPESRISRILEETTQRQAFSELEKPAEYSIERLARLLSPAASANLEDMARQAKDMTLRRFGRARQLYAPLYVSNYCQNNCAYCGFNFTHKFKRTRLSIDQAVKEAEAIRSMGFRHILLLSGEDPDYASVEYFEELAGRIRKLFAAIDIEIYPCSEENYERLYNAGIDGITIYQETYDRSIYSKLHTKGPKKDYNWRLHTPQRAAESGFRRIGLGSLLGISDWRKETLAMAEHGNFFIKNFWKSQVSISFPRIRPAEQVDPQDFVSFVSDRETVQMMLALRLCFPDIGITISTRETSEFRENTLSICVTRISAGSKTNPGGYAGSENETVSQFEIDDDRTPEDVAKVISQMGFEPVWKDWDEGFSD